jgi:cell division initiation protein
MEKSADFIRKKEFHIVFKGYKPEEVDKFLDILSVEFDRLLKRNRELQDSLDKLKFENTEEDTDIKKVIQDALISAHKVAEDIKAQAKKEAEAIMDQRKAMEDRSLQDIEMKKLAMEESLIVLQGKYDDFKNRIKKNIVDMSQFVEDAGTGPDSNEYTEAGFEDIKFDAGEYKDQSSNYETLQQTTVDEIPAEVEEEAEIPVKENRLTEKLSRIERTSTDPGQKMSVFDNYNLNTERDSGSYFDRIQSQNLESKRESLNESDIDDKSPDVQAEQITSEDMQNTDEDDSSLKIERKKIDIANPDIIENFFRASDD